VRLMGIHRRSTSPTATVEGARRSSCTAESCTTATGFVLRTVKRREALREVDRVREVYDRVKEDLERADERTQNALRLLEDAL
jgi:hypothetical protein